MKRRLLLYNHDIEKLLSNLIGCQKHDVVLRVTRDGDFELCLEESALTGEVLTLVEGQTT